MLQKPCQGTRTARLRCFISRELRQPRSIDGFGRSCGDLSPRDSPSQARASRVGPAGAGAGGGAERLGPRPARLDRQHSERQRWRRSLAAQPAGPLLPAATVSEATLAHATGKRCMCACRARDRDHQRARRLHVHMHSAS